MEQMQRNTAVMSVPQFGGWDQKAPGATDYSVVFTQARANKKQMKIDLTEVKRHSHGDEQDLTNANHGHHVSRHGHSHGHGHARVHLHAHAHAHSHGHSHSQEDPAIMGKKRILTYINCCIRP